MFENIKPKNTIPVIGGQVDITALNRYILGIAIVVYEI